MSNKKVLSKKKNLYEGVYEKPKKRNTSCHILSELTQTPFLTENESFILWDEGQPEFIAQYI